MTSDVLDGRVALVTGGGRGLGRAIALALAKAGAAVAVVARSADQLAETVCAIEAAGGRAIFTVADVADAAAVKAAVAQAEARLGPLDLLINNAGIAGSLGPLWEAEESAWWRCFETNVQGPFLCARAALPGMIARRRGCIVNVASGIGAVNIPYMSAYAASKAALIRLTESLATEAEPYSVTAFAIQPGTVRTAMVEDIVNSPEAMEWLPWLKGISGEGRYVSPDAAARMIVTLASGSADALSGRMLGIHDNLENLIRRAAEIKRQDLYTLRLRRLSSAGA